MMQPQWEWLQAAIEPLRADHTRGASAIALDAVRLLRRIAANEVGLPPADALALLAEATRAVASARASMAPLAHVASHIWSAARESEPAIALDAARRAADALLARATDAPERIAALLAPQLGEAARIVTLSRSGTVSRVLRACQAHIAAITVLESRPGGEGIAAAQEFAGWLPGAMTVAPDAASALALSGATHVVIGADALLAEGYAVNKTGSYPLALVAREQGTPTIVVAEAIKIAPASWQWHPERFDPALILPEPISGVTAVAIPFERIPLALLMVFTESGTLDAAAIRARAQDLDPGYLRS